MRTAINLHLSGVSMRELALLDAATRRAESDIREMAERLERANRKVDAALAARRKARPPRKPRS